MELRVKIGDTSPWHSNSVVSIRQTAHRIHHADISANAQHFYSLNIIFFKKIVQLGFKKNRFEPTRRLIRFEYIYNNPNNIRMQPVEVCQTANRAYQLSLV